MSLQENEDEDILNKALLCHIHPELLPLQNQC